MSIMIALVYLFLAIVFTRSNINNKRKVRQSIHFLVENEQENVMSESLRLKMTIIKCITIAALGFCVTKNIQYAIINILNDNFAK